MGPGLKSLSCLTASGTGRRVRRALGSADPREQHVEVGLALGPAVHLGLHVREDGAGPQGRGRHVGAHQGLEDVVGVHRDVAGQQRYLVRLVPRALAALALRQPDLRVPDLAASR